jgi:hypothetical protein
MHSLYVTYEGQEGWVYFDDKGVIYKIYDERRRDVLMFPSKEFILLSSKMIDGYIRSHYAEIAKMQLLKHN